MPSNPIAYKGIAHVVDPKNQFVFPILRAEPSSYSYNHEKKSFSKVSGEHLSLVSGYQTRKNNRVILTGSMEMCSDKYFAMTEQSSGDVSTSSNF